MKQLKYGEILSRNREWRPGSESVPCEIRVLSNLVVNQLGDILEYGLKLSDVAARVSFGDYDNIVQESMQCQEDQIVLVHWDLCNLSDGLYYRANTLTEQEVSALIAALEQDLQFVLTNLRSCRLVIMNRFTCLPFAYPSIVSGHYERICDQMNQVLAKYRKKMQNLRLLDLDRILAAVGLEQAMDLRMFYSSKALYSVGFFREYVQALCPVILAAVGRSRKVLVLDCDGTLWPGILGEDGPEAISLDRHRQGSIFREVQTILREWQQKGVLLALCSKNNAADVDAFLADDPGMVLRDEHFACKKVNWQDKVGNIQEIAEELNVGLNSMVFLDDSDYEIELVQAQLPQVVTVKVPKALPEYPHILRGTMNLFYNLSQTAEDSSKTLMYRQQAEREQKKRHYTDLKEYLASLNLKMACHINSHRFIARMSQLTQKTNQFNLTTQRYTETEIQKVCNDSEADILAFQVSDHYGDYGLTGLAIIQYLPEEKRAEIGTLLMSCRVLGRNVEYAFMDFILRRIAAHGCDHVQALYRRTQKNSQVQDFYEKCGFQLLREEKDCRQYGLVCNKYSPFAFTYIQMEEVEEKHEDSEIG